MEKVELLYQAFQLYKGEFLEEVGVEEWAVVRSVKYKQWYEQMLHELLHLLREAGDFERMREVSNKACQLYPYDEWQVELLESLKALGRKQEALEVYRNVMQMYREDLDIDVPRRIMEQMYDLGDALKEKSDVTKDVRDKLELSLLQSGAACLNFQNFVDTFRLMLRLSERNGNELSVMLCELDMDISFLSDKEKIDSMMQTLKETIQNTLRRGDCFTQYNGMKYLILLSGTGMDKCHMVFERLEQSFKKNKKPWMSRIKYQMIALDSLYKVL